MRIEAYFYSVYADRMKLNDSYLTKKYLVLK